MHPIEATRKTRSGAIFSAWDPILPANQDFSFESNLLESIQRESREMCDLFSSSPLSTPPSSRASSPCPPSPSPAPPIVVSSPSPPIALCSAPHHVDLSLTNAHPSPSHQSHTNPSLPSKRKRPAKKRDDKKKGHQRRKEKRLNAAQSTIGATVRAGARTNHVARAQPVETQISLEGLKVASTGYVGLKACAPRRLYFLKEISGPLRLVKCRDDRPRPFVDHQGRVIALWAGQPSDPSWQRDMTTITSLLEDLGRRGTFSSKQTDHGRGSYSFAGAGYAHGGGRTIPSDINPARSVNHKLIREMVKEPAFERLARFISNVFASWAPKLYQHYLNNMNDICNSPLGLRRSWLGCVFAATIFNLGPQTVTYRHKDHGNLPFGWCAVTALGTYNFTRGGHIVLWDLGLIVEFPPGSSFFLPSATLEHSNTAIQSHEKRYSITRYTAGALFRWVEHGMQGNREFTRGLSADELQQIATEDAKRYELGLSLFSTYSELAIGNL